MQLSRRRRIGITALQLRIEYPGLEMGNRFDFDVTDYRAGVCGLEVPIWNLFGTSSLKELMRPPEPPRREIGFHTPPEERSDSKARQNEERLIVSPIIAARKRRTKIAG
jgi:hypothetical protein